MSELQYSYFTGLVTNLSLSFPQWFFYGILTLTIVVAISSYIHLKKMQTTRVFVNVVAFLLTSLLLGGGVGFLVVLFVHFISYALVTDFRKDY